MSRAIGAVLLAGTLAACSPLAGRNVVARTEPPTEGARGAWCEAELPGGARMSCGSPQREAKIPGDSCSCVSILWDDVFVGRVVAPSGDDEAFTASRAFLDEGARD